MKLQRPLFDTRAGLALYLLTGVVGISIAWLAYAGDAEWTMVRPWLVAALVAMQLAFVVRWVVRWRRP